MIRAQSFTCGIIITRGRKVNIWAGPKPTCIVREVCVQDVASEERDVTLEGRGATAAEADEGETTAADEGEATAAEGDAAEEESTEAVKISL